MLDNEESFTLSITGDVTGEKLWGTFKAKKRLSHRDRLNQDKLRREMLGDRADGASIDAASIADAVSEIAIRLTDAPQWWKASNNGLDLMDGNVISEVYKKVMEVERKVFEELNKKAEDAEKTLKESAEKELK